MSWKLEVMDSSAGSISSTCLRLWKRVGGIVDRHGRLTASEERVAMQEVGSRLSDFNRLTEEVFLPVGARLMGIQSTAGAVAKQVAGVAGRLSDHDASVTSLDRVLLASGGDRAGARIADCVKGLRTDAKALGSTIEAFAPILHTFDVLAVMTRIESARFADVEGSFAGLATSVLELSQQIREQVGSSATSVAVLLRTVSAAAAEAAAVATQRQENLEPLMEQTSTGLRQIGAHRSEIAKASAHLASQFDGIAVSVGDLVVALQAQDIVRQQIEHVQQALLECSGASGPRSQLPAIARLQAAQLNNARAVFEASVHQVRGALCLIERKVSEVATEATNLLGTSEGGEPTFFGGVRKSLGFTVELLSSNREAEQRLVATAATVRQSVSEIVEAIAGVRAVGLMMQRIALNATIQAARLGEAGASMEIVANAIQELAREAEQASEETEKLLEGISSGANSLESTAESFGETEAEIAGLRQDGAALDQSQAHAGRDYQQSMELVEGLKQSLAASVDGFGTQEEAIGILAWASGVLQTAALDAPMPDPRNSAAAPVNYTMRSERSIHAALSDGRTPKDEDGVPAISESGDGDDVEFF
ncbi:methyl-accepting chemotaxis protein [Paludibaculum fermentans]|uniref:methyl-accepting chemotaxis protein n=1 Tax=Paludibaculum fermentans TaxID=1473598 RepID=UPI003EBA86CC